VPTGLFLLHVLPQVMGTPGSCLCIAQLSLAVSYLASTAAALWAVPAPMHSSAERLGQTQLALA